MTDRINRLTVIFEKDVRDDDMQPVADAIKLFPGVLAVEMNVANPGELMAETRAHCRIRDRLMEALELGDE